MASRTHTGSSYGRRILWLVTAVIIAVLAYTGLWFHLARTLEQRAAATIAGLNGEGVRAFCEEPDARGYPFRLGLFCGSVFYENVGDGISFRAGAFRSAAQIYQPFQVVGELDGPASIVLPFTASLEARWEVLHASARLAEPLPERGSVEGRQVVLSYQEGDDTPLATADAVQLHARQQGSDLEAAANFSALSLHEQLAPGLPALEGRVRAIVDNGVALLASGPLELRGQSATIHDLTVGVAGGEAGLSLSGPVAVATDGLIDAELAVEVHEPAQVGRLLAQVFPEAGDEIMAAAAMLGGLGEGPLHLRVERGHAFIGFIPIGRIPPV